MVGSYRFISTNFQLTTFPALCTGANGELISGHY
jgi:hypothetical protein